MSESPRPPVPPFSYEDAVTKVRKAEDAWNACQPEQIAKAYSIDSQWRNRAEIFSGREAIIVFLQRKWEKEHDYRLIKEIWAHSDNRIAVRFAYEWHDSQGQWFRSYGNENWQFDAEGRMTQRHASINDISITEAERKFKWQGNIRPESYPGLTELGL